MASECPACRLCGWRSTQDQGAIPDSDYFAGCVLERSLPGGRLWSCARCRSAFRHPILSQAEYLSLYRSGAPEHWSGSESREDLRIIRSIVSAARVDSTLDVGCGSGDFLASLPPHIAKSGIEPSPAAALARDRGIEIVARDLDTWATERRFDVITLIDVVEHVPDPGGFMARAYAHLRPGGVVIVSTGDPQAFAWRLLKSRFWYVSFPEHISFPAGAFFEQWCARTGALMKARHVTRYRTTSLPQLSLGLAIQGVFFASPRAFNWAGRLLGLNRAPGQRPRRGFSPGIPGTFLDHQIVLIGKP